MFFRRSTVICIALICLAIIIPANLLAQDYSKVPFRQFFGTWEWRSGTDVFRLILQHEPNFKMPDGTSPSVILGRHRYVHNGIVVEQSLDKAGQDGNPGFTLFGMPQNYKDFHMSFHDITKNKLGRVTLILVPGNANTLQWHLTVPTETVDINRVTPEGFSVPTDMVLKRVK